MRPLTIVTVTLFTKYPLLVISTQKGCLSFTAIDLPLFSLPRYLTLHTVPLLSSHGKDLLSCSTSRRQFTEQKDSANSFFYCKLFLVLLTYKNSSSEDWQNQLSRNESSMEESIHFEMDFQVKFSLKTPSAIKKLRHF